MARANKTKVINRKLKRRRLIVAAVVTLPILGFVLFSSRGIVPRMGLEYQRDVLQEEIAAAKDRRDSLRAEIERLQHDSLLIEKLARERYGMIKPGETVYLLEKE